MPQLINRDSDSESGSEAMETMKLNARASTSKKDAKMRDNDSDEDEIEDEDGNDAGLNGGEGGEGEEEEYTLEKIKSHVWDADARCWKYETKWLGYDNPDDITWEPRENLEGAPDMLEEYHGRIGMDPEEQFPDGPPPSQDPSRPKKRGRKSAGAAAENSTKKARNSNSDSPAPAKRKRAPAERDDPAEWGPGAPAGWSPPEVKKDAWENLIQNIETIEPDENDQKWAYLRWYEKDNKGNSRKTKELLYNVYKAAPQEMLKFYERHLVFGKANK